MVTPACLLRKCFLTICQLLSLWLPSEQFIFEALDQISRNDVSADRDWTESPQSEEDKTMAITTVALKLVKRNWPVLFNKLAANGKPVIVSERASHFDRTTTIWQKLLLSPNGFRHQNSDPRSYRNFDFVSVFKGLMYVVCILFRKPIYENMYTFRRLLLKRFIKFYHLF